MEVHFVIITLLTAFVGVFCEDECPAEKLALDNLNRLGAASNKLGFSLYQKLAEGSEGNVFISPLTISSALTMLYYGAKNETAEELRIALGYGGVNLDDDQIYSTFQYYFTAYMDRIDHKVYSLGCASAMLVNKDFPLSLKFKNKMQDFFQAYLQNTDITNAEDAVQNVNSWISKKTRGMITNAVESVDPEMSILLMSVAYFKGAWRIKFDPENTKLHPFYNYGRKDKKIDVPMMHSSVMHRYYDDEEDSNFRAVELAYEGRNMSMVIFLPRDFEGLSEMEKFLTPGIMKWVRRRMYYTKVHFTLPKFKLSFNSDLLPELQSLGLVKVFTPKADFSGITSQVPGPLVSRVQHKATISVSEEGTVAASYTSVLFTKMIPIDEVTPEFLVNHPFLFAVFDTKTDMILFVGRINEMLK